MSVLDSLRQIRVADVMLKNIPIVSKDHSLTHVVKIMDKHEVDRVIIVKEGRLIGIATKKDIISKLGTTRTSRVTAGRLHISGFMTPNPLTISPNESIVKAAKIMIEKDISSLPVVENNEVKGLITKWCLLEPLKEAELKLKDLMSTIPVFLKTTDRVIHARRVILDYNVEMLPVLNELNKVVGTISIDEIADALFQLHELIPTRYRKERLMNILLEDIMRLNPPLYYPNAAIRDAIREMIDRKIRGVIVINEVEERPIGIVTLTDITKYIATL